MKIDPKTGLRYDHTPAEWAQVFKKHGAGLSLTGSSARHLRPRPDESKPAPDPADEFLKKLDED